MIIGFLLSLSSPPSPPVLAQGLHRRDIGREGMAGHQDFVPGFLVSFCSMAIKGKQVRKSSAKSQKPPVITNDVGDYEKHPFFVKKVNEAKEFLTYAGLSNQFVKGEA